MTICTDVTHKEPYTYDQIKNVADANNIPYTNEGIGSLILSVIKQSKRSCRESWTDQAKQDFIKAHHHQCASCHLHSHYLEIDHIVPLAAGGSNDATNLQCLCKDCHIKKTVEEKESGAYISKDDESSIFNETVLTNVVLTNEFKTWQFVERLVPPYEVQNIYKIDMRKCRRNLTYYSEYEFPVYSVMDMPKPFSGSVHCGYYYVETTQTYLFRGNGWYSQPLIEYAIENQLIGYDQIKAELIPSTTLPKAHFRTSIDALLTAFANEPTLQKLSVNSLVGLFGRTKHSISHTKFTLCPYEASKWWGDKSSQSGIYSHLPVGRRHLLVRRNLQ